jgi:hypothetical protein
MTTTQTIFFDESGYTGNHLLSQDQPVFVYASVAINSSYASSLHSEMLSRLRLSKSKGTELKGANLVGYPRGRETVTWLLNECKDVANFVFANKKFALAGKFFEYTFEPVLKANNSLFYAVGFHDYISNLMYILLESKDKRVENIMAEFESVMKTKNLDVLKQILTPTDKVVNFVDPLAQILTFCLCHIETIREEIKGLAEVHTVSRWALELTTTSLFWLLSFWSERFEIMEVYCDKSAPLETNRDLFDVLIGRKDKIYMKLGSKPTHALTYNLSKPIELLDSKQSPGIQIADILSSSIAFAFKNPDDEISKQWLDIAFNMFSPFGIFPNPKSIDLTEREPVINALILQELIDRTLKGQSLLVGMPEFIANAMYLYEISPPKYEKG